MIGSLILSYNARPMPTVMVERAEARAFETQWLSERDNQIFGFIGWQHVFKP